MSISRRKALLGLTSLLAAVSQPASAEKFPDKPVKIIVGFTSGGAADIVARSPADGYTLMLCSQSTMVVAPVIYPKLGFDPVKDFTPLNMLVTMPMLLVVHPSVPAKTVLELVALAKAGKEMTYASAGAGGPQHVAGELFASMGKLKLASLHLSSRTCSTKPPPLCSPRTYPTSSLIRASRLWAILSPFLQAMSKPKSLAGRS